MRIDRGVRVGDEVLEALRVPLRVAGRKRGQPALLGGVLVGITDKEFWTSSAPIQSCSASSWSNTALSCIPSTSIQSRFFRPADSWLITAEPATPPRVRNRISALSSVVTSISGASLVTAQKLAAVAAGRCGMVIEVVETSSAIRSPVDPLHQIAPVRADIAERARRAAGFRVDPPAGGQRVQQPVLEIAAVHQVDGAERVGLHLGP